VTQQTIGLLDRLPEPLHMMVRYGMHARQFRSVVPGMPGQQRAAFDLLEAAEACIRDYPKLAAGVLAILSGSDMTICGILTHREQAGTCRIPACRTCALASTPATSSSAAVPAPASPADDLVGAQRELLDDTRRALHRARVLVWLLRAALLAWAAWVLIGGCL
jgi:hypothetical protein